METSFLVIFTFLLLQRLGASSESMMTNSSSVTCIERERKSLLIFKERLTDRHRRLSTWTGVECCEWVGVHCDKRSGHVIRLDLRNPAFFNTDKREWYYDNQLRGEVSPSLLNLKHLRYLDLSMNDFSGHIPKFLGSFKHLEYLNLSCSGFSGVVPHHLGNLSRLQYLDLNTQYRIPDGVTSCSSMSIDDLQWVPSLSSLKLLGLSGLYNPMNLTDELDWFSEVNMLPSLLTLNLAGCNINFPSITSVNFTSLNSLDLSYNFINSTIPVWLSNLTDLTHLELSGNEFHGQIPDFLGTLSALTLVDLAGNSFDTLVPGLFWNLSSLTFLDLSWNGIVADLPSLIGSMSEFVAKSLVYLSLAGNEFSGCIPNTIGDFKKLENLLLRRNTLSGHVPPSLGGLTCLKELDLSYNSLEGNLSEVHFIKLKNLTLLDLSSTSLALNVSSRWNPPFQLREFKASSCNIGPQFPSWLQTQTNLETLYLSNSSIRDTLPDWFENIATHIADLDLSYNQIGGELPAFLSNSQTDLYTLKMNSNKFEGPLISLPSNVQLLDLSDNLLSGAVPKHLCSILGIWLLDLSHNNFSGRLPRCLWNLDLYVIDLTNNSITGFLPSSLGFLRNLISLHLSNNRFTGDLPPSLQNLTSLVTMDLGNNFFTGSIPFWIGKSLPNLRILNLQSNQFTGKIPRQLCRLSNLQLLNLAHNSITGTIPPCFGNLSGMKENDSNNEYNFVDQYIENILVNMKGNQLLFTKTIRFLTSLDLSNNSIVGEIPDSLMNLVSLKNLNLSRNLLKGNIPIKIGNLQQVESLDLSMNMLSGRIPQSLATLHSISYLNLSFNKLFGPIPVGNQLQTLDDPSIYEGNNGLCGPPLSRCKPSNSSYSNDGKDEGLFSYVSMGPGFVVGFMGLLASLHFIRSWRLAYFGFFENVYGWLTLSILLNLARLRRKKFF
ncbi:receptor like protein 41 [Artemisia annua]|uniref:Receptor like protein 41 n=1 Tax=Artemisia annua TaxID=35608 RepID=A0A2U1M431_ARTAN|nr:receptor like protein 41 [Artemisia annua]